MGLEVVTHISDLVITNPVGAVDPKSQGDDHIRNIKKALKTDLPSITGPVTATQAELNILDGATLSTAELNILDGVTLTAAQINDAALKSAANTFTDSLGVQVSSTAPAVALNETDAGADEKNWRVRTGAGTLTISTYTDAGVLANNALSATRTGTTVTGVTLSGTTVTLSGTTIALSGTVGAIATNGNMTLTKASPFLDIVASTATDAVLQFSTNSTIRGVLGAVGGAGGIIAGSAVGDMALRSASGGLLFSGNNGTTLHFGLSSAGLLTTPNASPQEVGYKGLPPNSQTSNYTLVASDKGKGILCTTNPGFTVTIPANASVAFPIGTVINITNITGGNISIAITSDSMALGGTGTTGTRTLAHNGEAMIHKVTSSAWIITGAGVS